MTPEWQLSKWDYKMPQKHFFISLFFFFFRAGWLSRVFTSWWHLWASPTRRVTRVCPQDNFAFVYWTLVFVFVTLCICICDTYEPRPLEEWHVSFICPHLYLCIELIFVYLCLREDLNRKEKKTFSFGPCPKEGGGVYPCPDFLAPFFYQVIVLRIAFFTQTSQ